MKKGKNIISNDNTEIFRLNFSFQLEIQMW